MTDQVELLDILGVDPPGDAFRDLIDPDKVRELAESIRSSGLLQPILVRPINGRYEVVAGHRRLLAHKLLGEVAIKSIVREMTDEEVMVVRAVENDQREDLNPMERARVYLRLRERFNLSNRQIAQKMGRSPGVVDKYFKLLEVPDEFQEAVARRRLSIEVCLVLIQVEDDEFRRYYFAAAVENGITKEVAEGWLNDWRKSRAGSAYGDEGGSRDAGPVQEVMPIFQTCVCCVGPVEASKAKYILVCPECESQIRGALKNKE